MFIERRLKVFVSYIAFFVVIGWMIYSSLAVNYLANPDADVFLIKKYGHSEGQLGRIGLKYFETMLGNVVSPPISLIISLILYAVIILIFCYCFDLLKHGFSTVVFGMLVLLSPCTSSLLTYYCFSIPYSFAYLLVAVSFCLIYKCYNLCIFKMIGLIFLTALLCMISLTLYQAYLPVLIGGCALMSLKMALDNTNALSIIKYIICNVLTVFLAVGLYLIILKTSGTVLSTNRGFDSMGALNLVDFPAMISQTYRCFFDFFFGDNLILNSWLKRKWINIAIFVFSGVFLITKIIANSIKKFNLLNTIIIVCCVLFAPVCFQAIRIMSPDVNPIGITGIIMIPSMPIFYIFPIYMLTNMLGKPDKAEISDVQKASETVLAWLSRRLSSIFCVLQKSLLILKYVICFLLLALVLNYTIFTGVFLNFMWLNCNQTRTIAYSVIDDIFDEYGYDQYSTKVLFTGNRRSGYFIDDWENMKYILKGTIATKGYVWNGWLQNWGFAKYMDYYCGVRFDYGSQEDYDRVVKSEEWEKMPIYPNEGSIKQFDDLIVIKLGDEEYYY